jgi:hypothetical protein
VPVSPLFALNIFLDSFLHVPASDTVVAAAGFIVFHPRLPLLFDKFVTYKLTIVLPSASVTELSIHPSFCTATKYCTNNEILIRKKEKTLAKVSLLSDNICEQATLVVVASSVWK